MQKGPVAVFAGTGEGRRLCRELVDSGLQVTAFVATGYGQQSLPARVGFQVRRGRLNAREMREALQGFTVVVDATHPYAVEASANLKEAAGQAGVRYLRLLRGTGEVEGDAVVPDAAAAARFLADVPGRALLTTGSKTLSNFLAYPALRERLYVRILPDPQALAQCIRLGLAPSRLICMQGPFSHEMNVALLRSTGAKWLVTKDSGSEGGLPQKLSAAREAGVKVLLIQRPQQEEGYPLEEIRRMLAGNRKHAQSAGARRFPLFVDLAGASCLVVGGGGVGCRRIRILRDFGAAVTAVAPRFHCREEGVRYLERVYRPEDIHQMKLVVAATDDRAVNRAVATACKQAGIPVSVADAPEECSFFFPAVCRGPGLTAGVVSAGGDHGRTARAAAAIRTLLEEMEE